jgi:ribosomal protein S18 acetylase RimI-like enzyme
MPGGGQSVSVTVEPARAATAEIVEALARLLPQLTGQPATLDLAGLAGVLAQSGLHLLVARAPSGQIVGTATVVVFTKTSGTQALLEDVVVDTAARGQGIGGALTTEAVRIARVQGAWCLDLTSSPHREAANRLYRRLGFAQRATNVYRFDLRR